MGREINLTLTIGKIADALGVDCAGKTDIQITSLAEPACARADQLALAFAETFIPALKTSAARAAILPQNTDWQALGLEAAIFVKTGRASLVKLSQLFDPHAHANPTIHPSSIIAPSAEIGANAAIAPLVTIASGAKIGKNARIASHVSIGEDTIIGDNALILSGVKIGARVRIGNDFIAQPGVVIGSDGLSFENDYQGFFADIRQKFDHPDLKLERKIGDWHRINSLGGVTIGDGVEIGANTAIDRGTIRDTSIGAHTKIDNLVHIAHNVSIGTHCMICGQVGIAGTATLGNRIILAGQCGIADNIRIGDDTIAGPATKIFSSVQAGKILLGNPAIEMGKNIQLYKMLRRLPRFFAKLNALEDKFTNKT